MEEKIMESGEMYLETILILSIRKNLVRSIDIADYMKFSKPAVSRAVGKLKESKCIIVDPEGYIALSEMGRGPPRSTHDPYTALFRSTSAKRHDFTSLLGFLGV